MGAAASIGGGGGEISQRLVNQYGAPKTSLSDAEVTSLREFYTEQLDKHDGDASAAYDALGVQYEEILASYVQQHCTRRIHGHQRRSVCSFVRCCSLSAVVGWWCQSVVVSLPRLMIQSLVVHTTYVCVGIGFYCGPIVVATRYGGAAASVSSRAGGGGVGGVVYKPLETLDAEKLFEYLSSIGGMDAIAAQLGAAGVDGEMLSQAEVRGVRCA